MTKIAQPFLIGLALAPVGGIVGSAIMALYAIFFSIMRHPILDVVVTFFLGGLTVGSAFALPVSACIMPLVYLVLRRYFRVTTIALIFIGFFAGATLMLVTSVHSLLEHHNAALYWRIDGDFHIALVIAGSVAGAVVATIFGHVMRVRDPAAWNGFSVARRMIG